MLSPQDQAYWSSVIPQMMAQQSALTGLGTQTPDQIKRDQVEAVEFYPWLKSLCDRVLRRQRALWASNYNLWVKNALYFLSLQNLQGNGTPFGYRITFKDHRLYPYNIFRPNAEETIAAYFGAMPIVKWMAFEMEERRSLHIMREIEALSEYFDFQYFTEEMKMRTLMDGLMCGNRHFESWYDENCQDGIGWEQQYHEIEYPASISAHCYGCGSDSDGDEAMERCPQCGSSSLALNKSEAQSYRIPGDQQIKRMGDVITKDWSPLQLRYDLETGPDDSPWLYIEEDAPREQLEYDYNQKIEDAAKAETFAMNEHMHPMRAIRRAEAMRTVTGSFSTPDEFEAILKQRFIFEKPMFHFVQLSKPETLPNGTKIPAGVRLSEFFEKGIDCLTVPGGTRFFSVEDRSQKKRFVHGKHMIAPAWKTGIGNRDGARYNFQHNQLRSGAFRYLQKTLQPSVVASQQLFPKRDFWNLVDNVIHFSSSQLNGRPVSDHVLPLVPPALNPQIMGMVQQLTQESRESFKAYTSESDGFQTSNPTAHAAELSQQRRNMAHGMNMVLFSGTLKDVKVLQIELAQEHYDGMRIIGLRDEQTNQWRSKQIKAEDIQCGFLAYVVTGSANPDYPQQKRQKFADAISLAGKLNNLGLLNPASLQQVNQLCSVDLTFSAQLQHVEQLERAYQTMKDMDAQSGGQTPAEYLNSVAPVKLNSNNHAVYRDWWVRLLDSNDGAAMSPELERAINLRIQDYDLAMAAQAQRAQMLSPQPPAPAQGEPDGDEQSLPPKKKAA